MIRGSIRISFLQLADPEYAHGVEVPCQTSCLRQHVPRPFARFQTTRKYEALPDNERTGQKYHILSETATREILRSSYLNTFFTNGIDGNPYRSVHTLGELSLLLEEAVQAMAEDDSPFVPLQCAEGTSDDGAPEVTLASFLASPGLQVCTDE